MRTMASPAGDRSVQDSGESWVLYWRNNNLQPELEGQTVRATDAEDYAAFREPLLRVEDLVGTPEAIQYGITVRGLSVGEEAGFQYFILDLEGPTSLASLLRDRNPEHIFLHGSPTTSSGGQAESTGRSPQMSMRTQPKHPQRGVETLRRPPSQGAGRDIALP